MENPKIKQTYLQMHWLFHKWTINLYFLNSPFSFNSIFFLLSSIFYLLASFCFSSTFLYHLLPPFFLKLSFFFFLLLLPSILISHIFFLLYLFFFIHFWSVYIPTLHSLFHLLLLLFFPIPQRHFQNFIFTDNSTWYWFSGRKQKKKKGTIYILQIPKVVLEKLYIRR